MTRRHLTLLTAEVPVDRQQTNEAVRLSLLMADTGAERHNVYPLRRRPPVDETRARAALARPRTRVENVVPVDPPTRPAA